jgi:NlpC/P60 family putative phage cell wall peptidase
MAPNQPGRICDLALSWVGTPYHHYACVKGVGVDCAMLLVGIAREAGIVAHDWSPDWYAQHWHLHQTTELYATMLGAQGATRKTLEAACPGDILLFRWLPQQPASHAAILLPADTIVHARAARNPRHAIVRHEPLSAAYQSRLAAVYAWPEVA